MCRDLKAAEKEVGEVWGIRWCKGGKHSWQKEQQEQRPKKKGTRSFEDQKQATVARTVILNEHGGKESPAWTGFKGKSKHFGLYYKIKTILSTFFTPLLYHPSHIICNELFNVCFLICWNSVKNMNAECLFNTIASMTSRVSSTLESQ